MSHWADDYVGRPGEGERPCWLLVRHVWAERTGLVFPLYEYGDEVETIQREAARFVEVQPGEERELDAALMSSPVKTATGWERAEIHIGVVVTKGLVLHVHRGELSRIDPLRKLGVTRIMRLRALS